MPVAEESKRPACMYLLRFDNEPISRGSVPWNLLLFMERNSRLFRFVTSVGSVPENLLFPISRETATKNLERYG